MTSTNDRDDLCASLLSQLEHVELHVDGRSYVAGADLTDPGAMDWHARASLYVPSDNDEPGGESDLAWHATEGIALSSNKAPEDDGVGVDLTLFQASGITIDLEHIYDVFDALDARGQDEADFIPLFGEYRDQFGFVELADELEDRLEPGGSKVVILDRVRLAPAWRGLGGLGRLLTARIVHWVCDDPRLVAVQPFPIDLDQNQRHDDGAFTPAMQQVRRSWASLGFEPFTEKLWIMDPRKSAYHKAVTQISKNLGL